MAAGLGFKTFTTGEVLTAADTNGYLMQGLLVFADAAARDAAITSPQEGQACYLKDTDAVLTYSGTAWVGFDDSNAIQNAIINAKGDLIAGSANDTPAILAAGSNGETLVADSSTTTGLAYREDYAAGKNKIINGDFRFNQRSFSSTTTDQAYGFDRWLLQNSGGCTYSAQTFTPGTAPVAGYEAINFARLVTTGQTAAGTYSVLTQKIEDVRTFANQTVTVSFWAKAATGTPLIALEIIQNFGSGGSSAVSTIVGNRTLSTSFARYSFTQAIPTISGKTIGTSSFLGINLWVSAGTDFSGIGTGIQSNTFEIWGVQVEDGSVATAFNTATGTLAGELAACQRYYWRENSSAAATTAGFGQGISTAATTARIYPRPPVTMRVAPTAVEYANLAISDKTAYTLSVTNVVLSSVQPDLFDITVTNNTGATASRAAILQADTSSTAYIAFSAEL